MYWLITKYFITAALVVLISEVAKRSDRLGALIGALPLVTFLALIWMYVEGQPASKLSNHAFYTFWYVIPTLPMFIAFPFVHARFSFAATMLISVVLTMLCFVITVFVAKLFNVNLM